MTRPTYLLDTHALIFWSNRESVSDEFIHYFDRQEQQGSIYVSPVSIWEIAFLVKRGRLELVDVQSWQEDLLSNTGLQLLPPSATDMIDSVNLPDIHKDPFDRLLISQARRHGMLLVTRDRKIAKYDVETFWIT